MLLNYVRQGIFVIAGVCLLLSHSQSACSQTRVARNSKSPTKTKHAFDPAIRFAEKSKKTLESVTDFQATFHKMEIIKRKRHPHIMQMKLRQKPFSVYLKFLDPHEGREVIYVDGHNNGNILAHETGLKSIAGTVSLNPTSRRAMKEGKYPITQIGISNMLQGVIDLWKKETQFESGKINYYPNAKIESNHKNLQSIDCKVVESIQPQQKRGIEYHITRLYIDKKTNIPVRVEHFGFPRRKGGDPPLVAQYTYWNVKTNVGLRDIDFETNNPNYGF